MSSRSSVLTLLTDFGTTDYFVGAMKGVILGINPAAQLVDITHDIPPQDLEAGAFTVLSSYRSFPPGTVHLAVVDPGVGSTRRAIAIRAANQFFVGPDNGLFSYVLEREPTHKVVHITAEKYFRHTVSKTFHGRDVFAPVAAAISSGMKVSELGPRIKDPVQLESLKASVVSKGRIEGRIIHVDRFGNCVTNFGREDLNASNERQATIRVNGKSIKSFREFYGAESLRTDIFAIWGSAGFLELAVQNGSAADVLKTKRGDKATLVVGK